MMSNIIAKKVIIVGAGAAGIAAASRLYENGITDVLVLEAEDRIGGRIHTLDAPQGNILEIGAQWVHGEKGNAVYDLVCCRDLLIPTRQLADDMLFIESNGQIVDANITRKMSEIFEYVRSKIDTNVLEYKTSGNYFLEKISSALQNECECFSIDKNLESEFIEWFHQFTNSIDASDTWFQSSASTLTEYWECDGRSTIAWKENGYRQIFSILTENADCILGKSLIENYVRKHTEVDKIIPEDIRVRVKCDNGEEYVADHVIVTVSLGVLKANYEKLFPKNLLCDKTQKAIKNLSFGSVAKLFLIFPYKWWPDNITDFCLLWTQSDRFDYVKQGLKWLTDVFAFMVVNNCNETLCGWVCGQSARDMEALDEELVKNQLMQVLRKFLGCKYQIPEPVCFYRSTWKSNPHFNGTYSFRGISSDLMNVSAIDLSIPVFNRDNVPVILFAGEATHPHYYSTVHGAIETGWREADRLVSLQKCAK